MALFLASRALNGRTGHEVGRELLADLYRRVTGSDPPPITTALRGKPYFQDSPWHFSISHTKRHAFCALADHPVGIDAEELSRTVNPNLAAKILSPAEQAEYAAASDKNKALLTFWVLKEAAAKFTGEGLQGYPNHTAFSLTDPRVSEQDGCLVAVICD